jgi:OmpA-OmpF porin, OOP family
MPVRPTLACIAGAVVTLALAALGARATAPDLTEALAVRSTEAIAAAGGGGVTARFASASGLASRHPVLEGGGRLSEERREAVAKAVGAVPGVGGVRWADGTIQAVSGTLTLTPLHCQQDVEALLRARTVRFEQGSSNIDAASRALLDEVAMALRPCLGSTIAITGHTDALGSEPRNVALSTQRAEAVTRALIRRGIPADGLRARGLGSSEPVRGLAPEDPANRRIEFSVIAVAPLKPTPVDTPGPR